MITISTSPGALASLLLPLTLNDARPEVASPAVIVATWTILWFGGQSVQSGAGSPETTGGVLSILTVTGTDIDNPARFVAEQVRVVPGVSVVSMVSVQPDEDAMPDSGSITPQLTVTLL